MTPPRAPQSAPAVPLSRRRFLGSATVATAAACIPPLRAAESQVPAPSVIVGAHPWVYAATQPQYDITPILPAIFADMQYAGLAGIELMHTALRPADAVERIGTLAEKHQLPVLGTSVGHAPARKTEEQLDAQADVLRKIMALGAAHGVVLNLHNHTYEVVDNLHDLRGTLQRIPDVKLGPDLNWLVRGGVDPVWFIRQYARQLVFLHLRDQQADGRWPEALGEGAMDYAAVGRALHEVGFQGHAVIELAHERDFRPTRPLRESLKLSREFVRRTLGY